MDVKKVAVLANLPVNEDELTSYSGQLDNILAYIDQLQKTDISQVPQTAHISGQKNVSRQDLVEDSAPLVSGYIKVKAIFNND